ncbi:MAG: AAA family ATPase [Nitrospira sp.]|nr:AAA family ATPase [bacterium]MBL7049639.1 AAA family ATPase [Nitrospira sp.]
MKIAVTGKGGVGKTTLSSLLCHLYSTEGKSVIAVDADPDANLAAALGISKEELKTIRPIGEMADLVEERTGAKPGTSGNIFKINPKVDDIPEGFGYKLNNITLLVMGKSKLAASGCYCPEHTLLRRLLKHLIVDRNEVVVVDMEAGIEHMTRGTAGGVDAFIVVVEPGQRSIQTAEAVKELAKGLGVKRVFLVANKVRNKKDAEFIKNSVTGIDFLGSLSFDESIMESDISGLPSFTSSKKTVLEAGKIKAILDEIISKEVI